MDSETSVDDTVSEPNNDTDDELAGLGYEEARDQLIEVVKDLEAGGLSLEESLALWERGERLARLCERHLEGARERIDAALATVEQSPEEAAEDDEDGGEAAEDSS
ncbi:exodeoxyribonuclease VII small subunit [Saccharomonospora viridis]|uniref:Exodeoxyribonuclease 7 small subunit n=2 Tax=Saccharomonospora viridis TaxID=1852 RepID=C7MYN5_SACVD|nr:Exodeoxyribonuclease VII small subunit [Saccharomonospora viridis DSM 43017]KHF46112.1 exodeoxyribonuclease VII small subunit [Saccharomonospora viridis]